MVIMPYALLRDSFLFALSSIPQEFQQLCHPVLDDPRFFEKPGATKIHHAWVGGLAQHTLEVLEGALQASEVHPTANRTVIAVACVWHDYGKIFDIGAAATAPSRSGFGGTWSKAPHYTRVHHIARSYHEWMVASTKAGLNDFDQLEIAHCILAHHGKRDWGSPVVPETIEARLVHEADMASAANGKVSLAA